MAAVLVPDLELTAQGSVQGPKAEASAAPPPASADPPLLTTPVIRSGWFPSLLAGGGSAGASIGGGLGYRFQSGHALALEGDATVSVAPLQTKGWNVRVRYDF
jgi:hypothetical protein